MENFNLLDGSDTLKASRDTINNNLLSVRSLSSGTAFPTDNLSVGMLCYRTDQNRLYQLTDVSSQSWTDKIQMNINGSSVSCDGQMNGDVTLGGYQIQFDNINIRQSGTNKDELCFANKNTDGSENVKVVVPFNNADYVTEDGFVNVVTTKYANNKYFNKTGGTISGAVTVNGDINIDGDINLDGGINIDGDINLDGGETDSAIIASKQLNLKAGGSTYADGAHIWLYPTDDSDYPGCVRIGAVNATQTGALILHPDGTLTWKGSKLSNAVIDATVSGTTITLTLANGSTKKLTLAYASAIAAATATKPAVVVTTWRSGSSWYRIWSDGWVEQGGLSTGTSLPRTITLHKAMADANYTVSVGVHGDDNGSCYSPRVTTTATQLSIYGNGNTIQGSGINWHVCGKGV